MKSALGKLTVVLGVGLLGFNMNASAADDDCTSALVMETYNRVDSSEIDWRLVEHVNQKTYDEIKRNGGANVKIFSLEAGASFDDFKKRIAENLSSRGESLTRQQFSNVLHTRLDPHAPGAYKACIEQKRKGLHIAVRSATANEVTIYISWSPVGPVPSQALPKWSFAGDDAAKLPRKLDPGDHVVVLKRPAAQTTLAVNFAGYEDSVVLQPLPISRIRYVETTEAYVSEEITGWGTNFSAPRILCTPERQGWTILKVEHFLQSKTERNICNAWTTCSGRDQDSPTRACRAVSVQGHTGNKFSGYGTATSHLLVTWKRPVFM